eukprot:310142-Prymnesium_polylepis.2
MQLPTRRDRRGAASRSDATTVVVRAMAAPAARARREHPERSGSDLLRLLRQWKPLLWAAAALPCDGS